MTLKMDTVSPEKPDWYTFHGPCVNGWFMKMRNGAAALPGNVTSTSDSYAMAMSVPG